MSEQTFNVLKKIHKIMMILFLIISIFSLVTVVYVIVAHSGEFDSSLHQVSYITVIMSIANLFLMICGLAYIQNDYSKEGAIWYKSFMMILAFQNIISFYASFVIYGFTLDSVISLLIVIVIFILTFCENLGKKKTWYLYSILVVLEIIDCFLGSPSLQGTTNVILTLCMRLLVIGTIGLSIMGKYHDKDARGTV